MASKNRDSEFGIRDALSTAVATAICAATLLSGVAAQPQANSPVNYIVGPQDVLAITSYDQADMTGKFTVEADGTFTYPLIGRVKAGGKTLRGLEAVIRKQLVDDGYFRNPQITVAVETYKSQKVFIV